MADDDVILSVEHLCISFVSPASFTAVNDVSFRLGKRKTLTIVGESGSGKSLTALSLMGLLPADALMSGVIKLNQKELKDNTLQQLRGKEAGMVFQEPMTSLNPLMTVGKQLREAILTHQRISPKDATLQAINWLQKVQLLDPANIFKRYPHQLSGGQRQRVMIAIAMCNHPALLIADEPTTALDVTVQREIIQLMQYLQQEQGTALIFITHDLALACAIADEMLVMEKGKVIESGKAADIMMNPQQSYTRALLACRPTPEMKGKTLPVGNNPVKSDEQTVTATRQNHSRDNPVLLSADQLKISYAEHGGIFKKQHSLTPAVDNVSFQLNKREVLGLVGESGSGKSTLAKAIVALIPTTAGRINFSGSDLAGLPAREWQGIRKNIQIIFQDPYSSLNPRMTVGEALAEPLALHSIVPPHQTRQEVSRLLELVQLPSKSINLYPHQFSGGQRQRIGIARALAVRPKLLICDEIVSSLDVLIQAQILNLLRDIRAELALSMLFISHDLSVVHYFCDRVMVMHNGKIVEIGSADQVLKRPQHSYTQKLVAAAY